MTQSLEVCLSFLSLKFCCCCCCFALFFNLLVLNTLENLEKMHWDCQLMNFSITKQNRPLGSISTYFALFLLCALFPSHLHQHCWWWNNGICETCSHKLSERSHTFPTLAAQNSLFAAYREPSECFSSFVPKKQARLLLLFSSLSEKCLLNAKFYCDGSFWYRKIVSLNSQISVVCFLVSSCLADVMDADGRKFGMSVHQLP